MVIYILTSLAIHPSLKNAAFQVLISSGKWFAAELRDKTSFGLAGCTVSPGFEYQDFEIAKVDVLLDQFPEYEGIIKRLS